MAESVRLKSPVNWAVLGLLIERPSYGYELAQRLERRYDGVLRPPVSQIYDALDRLERAEMIEQCGFSGDDHPPMRRQPRIHYRATEGGRDAFRKWIATKLRDDPQHVALMRRVAGAAAVSHEGAAVLHDLIDAYERACLEEASRLPLPPPRMAATPAAAAGELVERLVLAARRGQLDAHVAWIDYARKEIDAYSRSRVSDEPSRA